MRKFALKTSICNAVGYIVAVGVPTIIDPMIEHHLKYGARIYPLGYWVFLFSILVFGLTYVGNHKNWSAVKKSLYTLGALVGPTWLTLGNFLPERPHAFVLLVPIWFGILVATTVYVHNYQINFDFVHDDKIDMLVKVEKIKIEHDTWFKILLGLITMYGLALLYIYMYLRDFVPIITSSGTEQNTLIVTFAATVIINAILFFSGFVWEMLARMSEIRENLLNVCKASCITETTGTRTS